MRRLALLCCAMLGLLRPAEAAPQTIRLVEFDDPLTPISVLRITKAIDDAEHAGDAFVLIQLDTPGGLVDSMETVVKRLLSARVPVVVWVGPAGAKAASAGFFLLIAADVAAMAPGTRAGAAKTVFGFGDSSEQDRMLKKADEDLAALLRSIAGRRGRNIEACQEAVFEARAYEEQVALERGLIDLVADGRDDLLARLNGREIRRFDGTATRLDTTAATFVTSEFSLRHRFVELLAVPAVAAFLLFAGLLGLYVEFTHPGVVFPGVVGALCLLLFALSAQVLPVSAVGVLLVALALLMFLLEIKVTSYGMLTVGGAFALLVGGWMLIEGPIPELRVPLAFLIPLVVSVTVLCALVVRFALRAHRTRVETGVEGLTGEVGTVSQDLTPEGTIFVHGELWNAVATEGPLRRGTRVRVTKVQDMQLTVEPAGGDGDAPSAAPTA